jgi:CheY-like chemotaxis protein
VTADRSALLRADWTDGEEGETAAGLELAEGSVFVASDRPPSVGTSLELRLSFAGGPAVELAARVSQVRFSSGPGALAGFVAEFVEDEKSAARVRMLIQRTSMPPVARYRPFAILHVEPTRLLRDLFASIAARKFDEVAAGKLNLAQVPGAADALASLDRQRFDALLVEHDLPDGSGAAVVERARGLLGPSAWIVGIGATGGDTRDTMLGAGADLYLKKPIAVRDLVYTIGLLMQRGKGDVIGSA